MTRSSFVLTLFVCTLLPGAPASAQEATDFSDLSLLMGPVQEGLTADQVAVLAVTNAPQAEAAAAAQARAEAAYREVRVGLFPQLALQANYTRLSEVDLPPFDIGGTIIDNPFPQILNTYLLRASLSIPVTRDLPDHAAGHAGGRAGAGGGALPDRDAEPPAGHPGARGVLPADPGSRARHRGAGLGAAAGVALGHHRGHGGARRGGRRGAVRGARAAVVGARGAAGGRGRRGHRRGGAGAAHRRRVQETAW
jgi:hypothetical protein